MIIRATILFISALLISIVLFFAFWVTRPAQKLDPGLLSLEKSIELILSSYVDKDRHSNDELLSSEETPPEINDEDSVEENPSKS